VAGLTGGDIGKGALMGGLGGAGSAAGNAISSGLTDTLGSTGANIVGNIARAEIASGGKADPVSALISGGLNAGTNAVLGQIDGFSDLSPAVQKSITAAVSNTLQTGNVNPSKLVSIAIAEAKSAVDQENAINPYFQTGAGTGDLPSVEEPTAPVTVPTQAEQQPAVDDFIKQIEQYQAPEPTVEQIMASEPPPAVAPAAPVEEPAAPTEPTDVVKQLETAGLTNDYSVPANYNLFSDSTAAPSLDEMGGGQGFQVAPVDENQNVGYEPVDYSLNTSTPFEGLQMPTAPNIDSMGGGQGFTVPVAGGTMTESGFIPTGTAPDLGDPNSFINKPAPGGDVSAAVKAATDKAAMDRAAATKAAADKAASDKAAADKAAADKAAADKAAAEKAARDKAANDAFNQLKAQAQAQQNQQDALMKMMSSNNDVAHIKSNTNLFGAIPGMEPPASSAQQQPDPVAALQGMDQQYAIGGHVDDFDVDALLHILRS
jgi:hypothetical protein